MLRLVSILMVLIQTSGLTAQEKYLVIEVKNHNIELFMNISELVASNWDDSLHTANIDECYDFDTTFYHTWESYIPDSVLTLCFKEFDKLYFTRYNKSDTTICEFGCMSFRFYDKYCQLISEYMLYNKLDTIKFLKQLIINCEKKMKSNEFKKLFLYYIEINEDY